MLQERPPVDVRQMVDWAERLAALRFDAAGDEADLTAMIEALERVKDACTAGQARATQEYAERCLAGLPEGSPQEQAARRDVGGRIARARHVSPARGARYLDLARILARDLPRTLDALAAGHTNEHRAALVAHAADCLGGPDRAVLDADLGPRLAGLGDRAVQSEADRLAAALDPTSVVERHRRAVRDRRVTLRPAPDTMTYLTALLPVAQGVAAWTALDRHATRARSLGDRRTRGQVMADELVVRLTDSSPVDSSPVDSSPVDMAPVDTAVVDTAPVEGRSMGGVGDGAGGPGPADVDRPSGHLPSAAAPNTGSRPRVTADDPRRGRIDLMLVMTDRALLDGADDPAMIPGHGPIPAALARGLLADADRATRVYLRRLYTDPAGNQILTADARTRLFPRAVRQVVLARDQRCRTPWCDAPIRDIDHVRPYVAGGDTDLANAQGLCRRCNLVKGARVAPSGPPPPPPSPQRTRARGPAPAPSGGEPHGPRRGDPAGGGDRTTVDQAATAAS